MKIYIGFSCPTGKFEPFAWLIKKVEARPYDHCYVRFQEPSGQWMIFQASKEMVNMYSILNWVAANQSLKEYEIDVTQDQSNALWSQYILPSLGIPYSLMEDLGILIMKVCKWVKNNPFAKGMSAAFCSENAARVCGFLGLKIPDDADNIDPTELDSILGSLGLPCVLNPNLMAV